MNAITKQNPSDQLRQQLAKMNPELKNALPSHIKPEKFQRVVLTVTSLKPELLAADRRSLLGACMRCAADGLVPDGREAALVIFNTKIKDDNGKDKWIKAVQYMPMMAGLLKKIRNSDAIASIQAHVIYENDKFLIRRGLTDTLEHEPLFPGDRGGPIGAYAVAKFKDGSDPQFEVMDINEIGKVSAVSRSRDKDGNAYGPWKDWWDEMARKTVFRRLSKWLPMDAEVEALFERDDANDRQTAEPSGVIEGIVSEADAGTAQLSAPSKLDSLVDADGVIEGDLVSSGK